MSKVPESEVITPVHPTADVVIVSEVNEEETMTPGGILVTPGDKGRNQNRAAYGRVVAVGPGKNEAEKSAFGIGLYLRNGVSYWLAVGDIVTFPGFAGHELVIRGRTYRALRESDILGVMNNDA
jgi:co-chaperonin GroES (HSP10)